MLRLSFISVCIAIALSPLASGTSYIGGPGDVRHTCGLEPSTGYCIGGAGFAVPRLATDVSVDIFDLTGLPVGAWYELKNARSDVLADGGFCRSAMIAIPAGSVELDIWLDEALVVLDCGTDGAPATMGEIHVTWR